MPKDKTIAALQRRLEKWELQHLRALAAELRERLDEAEARVKEAEARAYDAWYSAEQWQENAMSMMEQLAEMTGGSPARTADGAIGVTKAVETTS